MGPIGLDEALAMAEEKGFDLVEVSPGAKPPVVKMMDYGKYKYEQQKKAAEARKRQKVIEIKEIKMRPTIDDHDYDTKMKAMRRFFDEGDKVKVTLRFRGREMAHQHIGMELLTRIQKETDTFAKIEQYPRLEGRQMQMVLAPRDQSRHPWTGSRSFGGASTTTRWCSGASPMSRSPMAFSTPSS